MKTLFMLLFLVPVISWADSRVVTGFSIGGSGTDWEFGAAPSPSMALKDAQKKCKCDFAGQPSTNAIYSSAASIVYQRTINVEIATLRCNDVGQYPQRRWSDVRVHCDIGGNAPEIGIWINNLGSAGGKAHAWPIKTFEEAKRIAETYRQQGLCDTVLPVDKFDC